MTWLQIIAELIQALPTIVSLVQEILSYFATKPTKSVSLWGDFQGALAKWSVDKDGDAITSTLGTICEALKSL